MDPQNQDELHMTPLSNTCPLMDNFPQTRPQEYGHTTVNQIISSRLMMVLGLNIQEKSMPYTSKQHWKTIKKLPHTGKGKCTLG